MKPPPIIEQSGLDSGLRRLLGGGLTLLLWALVLTLLATAISRFFFGGGGLAAIPHSSHPILTTAFLLGLLILPASLAAWARYNYLRFKDNNRRKPGHASPSITGWVSPLTQDKVLRVDAQLHDDGSIATRWRSSRRSIVTLP